MIRRRFQRYFGIRFSPDEGGAGGNPGNPGDGGNPGNPGSDENAPVSWYDGLPEDLRKTEGVEAWKDKQPEDLVRGHLDAQAKLKTALIPPGEKATDEERKAFETSLRKALAVPEKVEDYKLDLPPEVPKDDPVVVAILKAGHQEGVNNPQAQSIISAGVKAIVEFREAQKLVQKEALQATWGKDFDTNLATAIKGLEKLGEAAKIPPETMATLAKEIPGHAVLVRMMHEVGKMFSEDKFIKGDGNKSGSGEKSAAQKMYPDLPSVYDQK